MRSIIKIFKNSKSFRIKSQGLSMIPVLWPGDLIYFSIKKTENLKENDLILAFKNEKLFAHRVIYRTAGYLITKGDNNILCDGRIYPRQVIGTVTKLNRGNQHIDLENFYLIQSTAYFSEINKINACLNSGKVNFIFLKGLPIHLYYEKNYPRRIYADCDVLIDKDQSVLVDKILLSEGFIKHETHYSPIHKYLKNKKTEITYSKKSNRIRIVFDIHYEANFLMNQLGSLSLLYSQKNINKLTSLFLQEKRIIKISGGNFPVLSADNLVIYLLLHYFHHNFRGVFRLSFIDKVIRKDKKIDWKEMAEKIEEYKLNNFMYPGLLLLKKYFLTPVDGNIMSGLKPGRRESAFIQHKALKENIFNDEERISAGINRIKYIFILSSEPLIKKFLVFFQPAVLYSAFWVLIRLLLKKKIKNYHKT